MAPLASRRLDADPAWRLADAFLVGFRGQTRRAWGPDDRPLLEAGSLL